MATGLVYLLATTEEGTERGLKIAGSLANERAARVVILVPHVVSFALPLDRPPEDPAVIAEPYRVLAFTAGVDVTVRVCFCREPRHVFGRMLIDHAEVVVGGRRRRWWPSREERLARELAGEGHHVIFADVESGSCVERASR